MFVFVECCGGVSVKASILRMMEGSPQTFMHDPIVNYLKARGVKINLNTRIQDLLYQTDATGKPTKVEGLVVSSEWNLSN